MKGTKARLLVIDDDEDYYFIIKDHCRDIKSMDIQIDWVDTFDKGIAALEKNEHDIALVDYLLGAKNGLDLISEAIRKGFSAPLVLLTGFADDDLDRKALRLGATDYLSKDQLETNMIERTIRHSIERYEQRMLFHEQEAKFRTLFEQSEDGIYLLSNDWIIQDANDSFMRMFGLNPEDHPVKLLGDVIDGLEAISFSSIMNADGHLDNFAIDKVVEGRARHLLISCSQMTSMDGTRAGYQGTVRDITTIKQAEKQIANAEKFSLSGRMARIIAHEVRNPLSNISLASETMEDMADGDPETHKTYLDIIKRNADRISTLIDGLLSSTKSSDLSLSEFKLEEVVGASLELCEDRLKLKSVKVSRHEANESIQLRADFEKLKIVLVNIITNAVEAMENQPSPLIEISCADHQEHLELKVIDNGKGMDESTRQKLFDPFFTSRHGGMGLGMSSVLHLINQHKGHISVDSQVGEGSVFSIQLPKRQD